MKLITCASYYATGSSAVMDYVREFDNVKNISNYEFRFIHDPDGIAELEYNLVENFNRHNSGHAIKRYKRLVDYYANHWYVKRYEPFFNNKWKTLSYEYIDALTDFTFNGSWQYDYYDKGNIQEFMLKLPGRVLKKLLWSNSETGFDILKNEITYCSHPSEEKFLECTRNYTTKLINEANIENKEFIALDQIMPSSNFARHIRYFDNIKIILVERDPRDVFYIAKYIYKSGIVPKQVDKFCDWYKYVRSSKENVDSEVLLKIQFEDLVYHYEETTSIINNWLGLDSKNHINEKKFFNPDISIKNTRLWKRYEEYADEADYIAKNLPEYLYYNY